MNKTSIDLSTFTIDHSFYGELNVLISIKSFDLQAIRERYINTRSKKSNRAGSSERRKVTEGGIASLLIEEGEIKEAQILTTLPEPRGIDLFQDILAISSENRVYIFTGTNKFEISDPWFSYIHTVSINKQSTSKILISSSGFDSIFEFDFLKREKTFEWFAWENGFNKGKDPDTGKNVFLTRNKKIAERYQKENMPYVLISDPSQEGLPTAKRAAFINSVLYHPFNAGDIVATFFHEGAVYVISKTSGKAEKKLENLKNPHGGCLLDKNFYMATSTKSGEVVHGNQTWQKRYDFSMIKGKPDYLVDFEWIQNSIIEEDNIISIDSNRNMIIIFNPELQLIDFIPYNKNWAIQDIIIGKPLASQIALIKNLNINKKS